MNTRYAFIIFADHTGSEWTLIENIEDFEAYSAREHATWPSPPTVYPVYARQTSENDGTVYHEFLSYDDLAVMLNTMAQRKRGQ